MIHYIFLILVTYYAQLLNFFPFYNLKTKHRKNKKISHLKFQIRFRSRRFAISNKSAAAAAAAAAAEAESSRDDELDRFVFDILKTPLFIISIRLHDLKEGSPLNLESGIIPQIDRLVIISSSLKMLSI